jgi:nucleotide-binding universal stress UspA family protein
MYETILVPLDGSDTAQRGLQEAIGLAARLGSRLRLFHVVDLHMLYVDISGMANVPDCTDALREAGEAMLAEANAQVVARHVPCDTSLRDNAAPIVADVIIDEAVRSQAKLIVMGTHGRRGVRHMVMGSDAEGVVRRSPVPVLLVRAE